MKILVFEYLTGGGLLQEDLPPVLAREGDAMLRALVSDLNAIAGVELLVFRDARLPPLQDDVQQVRLYPIDDLQQRWLSALSEVDAVWPIAPESSGVLYNFTLDIFQAGKCLLSSAPSAVAVTTRKSATLASLKFAGIESVAWWFGGEAEKCAGPWVVKPDDGVGCEGLELVDDVGELSEVPMTDIVQPWLDGESLSLSVLSLDDNVELVSINRQGLTREGKTLQLSPIDVDVLPELHDQMTTLSKNICAAIPGLQGYFGVDLVLTDKGPVVIEVNPRLTMSYAYLSERLEVNLAQKVVDHKRASLNL